MRLILTASLVAALLFMSAACGGGGGGGGGGTVDPGAPGELRELAVEGQAAPGTAGTFTTLPVFPLMDAASGGWAAFVAPTSDATKTEVLYVAEPDTVPTIVDVFAVGDPVPGPSDGTVAGFEQVWMCADGTVLCMVQVAGDTLGRGFAVLSAVVATGAAGTKQPVIYDKADISAAVAGGVLGGIGAQQALKTDDGTLWFHASDATGGEIHIVSIDKDGTNLTKRASPGDQSAEDAPGVPGPPFATIDAFSIDPTGAFYGLAVTTTAGDRRIYLKESAANGVNTEVLRDADVVPNGSGTVVDAWGGGRLIVFAAGQIVWALKGSLGADDDALAFYGEFVNPNFALLARSTLTAPNTGAGTWVTIDLLNTAPGCVVPQFDALIAGGTSGATRATFSIVNTTPLVGLDTGDLVLSGQTVFPAAYVSLRQATRPYDEVAVNGDLAYALSWSTTSALFWRVRAAGPAIYPVAARGGATPGGDTFGSFSGSSAHTLAPGVVLFRAGLTTAGSAILRQGP